MILRHALLGAFLLSVPAAARAQGTRYQPGTTSYRISTATSGTQTSPLGNQDFAIGIEQRITVTIAPHSADTLAASFRVDSIWFRSNEPTPDVRAFQGATYTALLSPTGRVYSVKAPPITSPLFGQLTEAMGRFLPAYRADLREGMTWADTAAGKSEQQGVQVDRTTITSYRVGADTTIDGERAFRVHRHTTVSATGTGSSAGTPVSLTNSAKSDATLFVSERGAYLGGRSEDENDLTITLTQGAQIGIRQKAAQVIAPVR